jgi:hypothetical protein
MKTCACTCVCTMATAGAAVVGEWRIENDAQRRAIRM